MPPPSALRGLPRIPLPSLVQPPTSALPIPLTSGGTYGSRLLPGYSGSGVSSLLAGSGSTTATMTNLLPLAHSSLRTASEGVYLGEGVPPVPDKLAAKIRKGEFVEMGELLPEFWSPRGEESDANRDKSRRSRKVTDIFTWLQCFAAYVSVRAPPAPHLVPELMAYMATIVRVSQDFSGLAWVRYDAAFRRQAALTKNDRWSAINSTLYTMCFTGMASSTKRCELCFATTHSEQECAQRGDPDPGMKDRLKAIETAVLAMANKRDPVGRQVQPAVVPSGEPCRKWNTVGCTYPRCRHTHACSNCGGGHPACRCTMRPSYSGQGAHRMIPPNRGVPPGGKLFTPSKPSPLP